MPNKSRLFIRLVWAAAASACGASGPPVANLPDASARHVQVNFVDYNRNGTLADHAGGTAYIFDDAIKVVLRNGVFPFTPSPSLHLVALSAALATGDTADRWDRTRESPKVYVRDMRTHGDTLADSVVFWIQHTRAVNLREHWLMLTEYAQFYIRERGAWTEANRPIHGSLAMFREAGISQQPPNER